MYAVIAGNAVYPVDAKNLRQALSSGRKILRSEQLQTAKVVEIVNNSVTQSQEIRR